MQRNISEIKNIRRRATEKKSLPDNESEKSDLSVELEQAESKSTKLSKAEMLELADMKNVESEIKTRHNLHLARKRTLITQNYNE